MDTITIDRRFNGPPDSGHGGYVAGRAAELLDAPVAQVTLRAPPPLGVPLAVHHVGDGFRIERDGETIAEAVEGVLDLDVPAPVSFDDAVEASRAYAGFEDHIYPRCFVCGPARAEGDGLRIFPGLAPGGRVGAGPWIPHASVVGDEGLVGLPAMWAALDCPSMWGVVAVQGTGPPVLLGRLTARIDRRAREGERCVSIGWPLDRDGRKIYAAAALFGDDGELLGASHATWITPRG